MNERIRQLAHEAGLPTYNPDGIPTKLEKFAQSIIAECLYLCENTAAGRDAEAIQAAIQQRFGVDQ